MPTYTICSLTDIRTYVDGCHPDFAERGLGDALADAIQTADHPDYGRDWAEWLDENIGALRYAAACSSYRGRRSRSRRLTHPRGED